MPWRFKVDGALGKAALYTVPTSDSTDDSPLTDPRGNLSRVRFHTDFKYPRIVDEKQFSVSLSARSANTGGQATHTLGAHGRPGAPLCFAAYYLNGSWLPLFISSPVSYWASGIGWRLGRLISLGADDTNLLLHEYYSVLVLGSGAPSVTIDVRVLITSETL